MSCIHVRQKRQTSPITPLFPPCLLTMTTQTAMSALNCWTSRDSLRSEWDAVQSGGSGAVQLTAKSSPLRGLEDDSGSWEEGEDEMD